MSPGVTALGTSCIVTLVGVKLPPHPALAPVVMSYTEAHRSVSIALLGGSVACICTSSSPSSEMPPVGLAVNSVAQVVSVAPPASVVGSIVTLVGLLAAVNVRPDVGLATVVSELVATPKSPAG